MLTQRFANIVFAIIVIAACLWFAVIAESFQAAGLLASSGLPSKFFPQVLLAFTAICAAIVGLSYWWHGEAGGDADDTVFASFTEARRGVLMLVVAVACYYIWRNYGFIPMAVILGPVSLLVMGVRAIGQYIVVTSLTGVIYLVFTFLLQVQLT